jgi:hypothetical protein
MPIELTHPAMVCVGDKGILCSPLEAVNTNSTEQRQIKIITAT